MKKTAGVILCCLLLGLVLWMWQEPSSKVQGMEIWQRIVTDNIHKIIIQKQGAESIVLHLQQDKWHVANGDLAGQDRVLRLLDDLTTMQVVRVVTRNPSHDADLGLLKRAITVRCLDAQGLVLLDITVGKQGSDLLSTYVRRAGDDTVVAVNKALLWQLKRSENAWKEAGKVEP